MSMIERYFQTSGTYIFRKKRIRAESTALTIVVCAQYDENVLDCDHQNDGPQHKRECAQQVNAAWGFCERGREDI